MTEELQVYHVQYTGSAKEAPVIRTKLRTTATYSTPTPLQPMSVVQFTIGTLTKCCNNQHNPFWSGHPHVHATRAWYTMLQVHATGACYTCISPQLAEARVYIVETCWDSYFQCMEYFEKCFQILVDVVVWKCLALWELFICFAYLNALGAWCWPRWPTSNDFSGGLKTGANFIRWFNLDTFHIGFTTLNVSWGIRVYMNPQCTIYVVYVIRAGVHEAWYKNCFSVS